MFEVFSFGSSGWGDEMLMGALMTVLVSASSLFLGILIGIIFANIVHNITKYYLDTQTKKKCNTNI